jgi:hypothetical protein
MFEESIELGLGANFVADIEVVAVFESADNCAGEDAVVGAEDGSREVFGIGVDGEAEEDELHHRDADHHAEGEPVAAHLDEFLGNDGPEPPEAELAGLHLKLSRALSMRLMKTSSRPGVMGRQRYGSASAGARLWRSWAAWRPLTWRVLPKATTCSMPGWPRSRSARRWSRVRRLRRWSGWRLERPRRRCHG